MARSIPGGIEVKNFVQIRKFLEQILKELKSAGAKRVVTRLNNSNSAQPAPHFVGIVEDGDLRKLRLGRNEPDAGLFRFGDDNPSKVYNETVSNPEGEIGRRNWKGRDYAEKGGNAKALGHEIGCDYQRFIAIRVPVAGGQHQHVGTITVGFMKDPSSPRVQTVMKKWAQNPKSKFVKFLKDNFALGGPTF
ncbi:MAG: hypothetical protein ACREQW_10455 [Candidatus Binatia bacterium]